MKGDVSSITQAVILAVIMAVIIVVSLVLVIMMFFKSYIPLSGSGQITHEFELIGIFNKPYSLAEALSSYKPNDRSFIENALESAIAGSLPQAQAQNIHTPVKDFLEFFGLRSYEVKISKGELDLLTVNNLVMPCSEGKGICTSRLGISGTGCGEGREQLPDNSVCSLGQVCCSVAVSENAKKCGEGLKGVCTGVTALSRYLCGEGRKEIDSANLCTSEQVCCKYKDVSDAGIASKAEIPLVYKGKKVGDVKVETSAS